MGPPEFIIIGIVAVIVIFGAGKLPQIARNVGRSSSEFKKGLEEGKSSEAETEASAEDAAPKADPSDKA